MAQRTITGPIVDAGGIGLAAGELQITPILPAGDLSDGFVAKMRSYPITDGAVTAAVVVPGSYKFEVVSETGERLRSFTADLPDTSPVAISLKELWESRAESVEMPSLAMHEGGSILRLIPGGGAPGQILSQSEGSLVWRNPPRDGDMISSQYDPLRRRLDVYNRSNHTGAQPIDSVTGLSAELAGIHDDITSVNADVAGLSTDVTSLSTDVSGLSTEITGISTDVAGISAELAGVSSDLAGAQSSIASLGTMLGLIEYATLCDRKAMTVQGGTFQNGADRLRTLNTVVVNNSGLADSALLDTSTSSVKLLPGRIYVGWAMAPAYGVGSHYLKLKKTDGTVIEVGPGEYSSTDISTSMPNWARVEFRISVPASASAVNIQVYHRAQFTVNDYGMGPQLRYPADPGLMEEYARLTIFSRPL